MAEYTKMKNRHEIVTKFFAYLVILIVGLPFAGLAQDLSEELWAAARKGDAPAVTALLGKGADVNAKTRYGATALTYAADRGYLEIAKILVEQGAVVNAKDTFYGAPPITWAAYNGHVEVVKYLLEKGAEGKKRRVNGRHRK